MSASAESDAAKASQSCWRNHFATLCHMNPTSRRPVLVLALLLAGACYHAIIETNATPASPVVERESMPWIDGLAPTDPVEIAESCPAGVSRVETHHSVLDVVANVLTLGLYTPVTITVACGPASPAERDLPTVLGSPDAAASVAEAVALAYASDRTVLLELPR
jgi:hypothetical protein